MPAHVTKMRHPHFKRYMRDANWRFVTYMHIWLQMTSTAYNQRFTWWSNMIATPKWWTFTVVTTTACLSQEQKSLLSPYTMLALSSLMVTPRSSLLHLPIYMHMQHCYVCVLNTLWSFRLTINTSGMAYNPRYVNSCLTSPIRLISSCWFFSLKLSTH